MATKNGLYKVQLPFITWYVEKKLNNIFMGFKEDAMNEELLQKKPFNKNYC